MGKIDQIKQMWADVYDPAKDTAQVIEQYFHPAYTQCVNGAVLTREAYTQHVLAQKANMRVTHIDYARHLEDENSLFAIYSPKGKTHEDEDIEAEVISYFRFEGDQVISIHAQVRLIKGAPSDVDMLHEV